MIGATGAYQPSNCRTVDYAPCALGAQHKRSAAAARLAAQDCAQFRQPLGLLVYRYSRVVPALLQVVKRQGAAIDALTARLE